MDWKKRKVHGSRFLTAMTHGHSKNWKNEIDLQRRAMLTSFLQVLLLCNSSDGQPGVICSIFMLPAVVSSVLKQNVLSNSSALVRKKLYTSFYAIIDGMHGDFIIWLSTS